MINNYRQFVRCLAFLGLTFLSGSVMAGAPTKVAPLPPAASKKIDFAQDVQPLFADRCVRCHGPKKAEGGLRLDRKADAFAGGNSGPALEPGKSAASRLIRYVAGQDENTIMPPSGKRLTPAEVGLLRAWIDQGAPWSGTADSADSSPRIDHWAFRPIARPLPPPVKNVHWVRGPIDRFILARLEKENLQPSPEADKVTLVRRLSLDLLGLPPTVADVDAFLADTRPGAYERLVERLLASPHYGERWGRHWLDAARYADSDGYNGDSARPVWKYRDWVIDALNRDLPFDQFVIEQIAGDLLPGATLEQKIATGFHRNTLFNAEGGNDPEEFRVERVADRVATTGVVFLGLTMGCAECHAHKYDPISQREYYEMFAFFNNAEEVTLETFTPQEQAVRDRQLARIAELKARLRDLDKASDPNRQLLAKELTKLEKTPSPGTKALTLAAARPRPTRIHVRGDFRRPGAVVTPNVPRVFPPLATTAGPTRLDLARWLASRDNPLTARVMVNRLWQPYFGKGLVETESDFGTQGSPPSHPELLDWLAAEFMERGWSMKALHRLIVTSSTYRQASLARPDLVVVDPRNRLLARQSRLRLEAEIVRDVLLTSSGLLSSKMGGPSVFPHQPPGVMETRRSPVPWVVSSGPDRFRRTLYTHFWRTSPHPFLMAFDAPKSDIACTRRHQSNTPLQALMLLNDPMFLECARALAARIEREGPTESAERCLRAFRLCLARDPSPAEHRLLLELLARQLAEFRGDTGAARRLAGGDTNDVADRAAWTVLARVLLNLDEMIVRE